MGNFIYLFGTLLVCAAVLAAFAQPVAEFEDGNYSPDLTFVMINFTAQYDKVISKFVDEMYFGINAAIDQVRNSSGTHYSGNIDIMTLSVSNDKEFVDMVSHGLESAAALIGLYSEAAANKALDIIRDTHRNQTIFGSVSGSPNRSYYWNANAIKIKQTTIQDLVSLVDYGLNTMSIKKFAFLYCQSATSDYNELVAEVFANVHINAVESGTCYYFDGIMDSAAQIARSLYDNTISVESSKQPEGVLMTADADVICKYVELLIAKDSYKPVIFASTLQEDELLECLTEIEGLEKVQIYATAGLPVPTQSAHPDSLFMQKYNAAMGERGFSFASQKGYLIGRFLMEVLNNAVFVDSIRRGQEFIDAIFAREYYPLDDLIIGPFQAPRVAGLDGDGCGLAILIPRIIRITKNSEGTLIMEDIGQSPRREVKNFNDFDCGTQIDLVNLWERALAISLPLTFGFFLSLVPTAIFVVKYIKNRRSSNEILEYDENANRVSPTSGKDGSFGEKVMSTLMKKSGIHILPMNAISHRELVGSGSFAKVYHANYMGIDVAVKQLFSFSDTEDPKHIEYFIKEIRIWASIKHPYVVEFLGVSPSMEIIMEYMSEGSLHRYVLNKNPTKKQRMHVLLNVSSAMEFLHSRTPSPILHRDMKPNNILVRKHGNKLIGKVADFGLSRSEMESRKTHSLGTPIYTSPSVLQGEPYSPADDVYAFALTMWFTEAGCEPYIEGVKSLYKIIAAVTDEDKRPPLTDCPLLANIIERGWSKNPSDRPTFEEISLAIKEAHDSLGDDA